MSCLNLDRSHSFLSLLLLFSVSVTLNGCAQIELASYFGKKIATENHSVGAYKVGSPYVINGHRYYPAVDYDYDKTGIASWYGPNFHGKKTANGEIYDQNDLTAAHKTLPLPSIVRVTNLENGRSLIVRVNDRGPYAHSRIIDMSKRSAELLGFKIQGTAKVRVQVLEKESRYVAKIARNGGDTTGMEVPMNDPSYKAQTSEMTDIQNKIHGHVKDGAFRPDPVVSKTPVPAIAPRIFVQVGSFSSRDTAMKYSSSLDQFGKSRISEVLVNGKTYYRVRFLASNVGIADSLLENLVQNGYENALIVVD